ncbi:SDR family oxidoreductase [Halopiger thermotolerans]
MEMADTVLITGCSTGIGRATARAFLNDGWQVYATARDEDELVELANAGAATARLNVTSTADATRVTEWVIDEAGRLDCLVNNAGYGQLGPVEDVPVEAVQSQFDVNTFGPHRLIRAAVPHMRQVGGGTIVNVTSFNEELPFPGTGVYSASKSALSTLSEAIRAEVAPFGIDVAAVSPAFVATDFYDRMEDELDDFPHSRAYADLYRLLAEMRPIQGGGPLISSPDAVAETVLTAAKADDPRARYRVGSLAWAGVLAGALPETWRGSLMRLLVRLMETGPAQRLLSRWNDRYRGSAA